MRIGELVVIEDRPLPQQSSEAIAEKCADSHVKNGAGRPGIRATLNPDLSDSPPLASFFAYWSSKRRGDDIPERAAIDPIELKAHLGNLLIVEPTDGGTDFRYRLVGTKITEINGRDYTGWTVRQVFAPSGDKQSEQAVRAYQLVANRHLPVRVAGGVLWARKEYITFDSILLPIWSSERNETWVIAKLVLAEAGSPGALQDSWAALSKPR